MKACRYAGMHPLPLLNQRWRMHTPLKCKYSNLHASGSQWLKPLGRLGEAGTRIHLACTPFLRPSRCQAMSRAPCKKPRQRGFLHGAHRILAGHRARYFVSPCRGAGLTLGSSMLASSLNNERKARHTPPHQMGSATRSWPCVSTMRARVNSPTFMVLLIFSGGSRRTTPSISGASA